MQYATYSYYELKYLLGRNPTVPEDAFFYWEKQARIEIDKYTFDRIVADSSLITDRILRTRQQEDRQRLWYLFKLLFLHKFSHHLKEILISSIGKDKTAIRIRLVFSVFRNVPGQPVMLRFPRLKWFVVTSQNKSVQRFIMIIAPFLLYCPADHHCPELQDDGRLAACSHDYRTVHLLPADSQKTPYKKGSHTVTEYEMRNRRILALCKI